MTLSQVLYYWIGRTAVAAGIVLAMLNAANAVYRWHRELSRQRAAAREKAREAALKRKQEFVDLMEAKN